jgi:hypothetical protein
VRNLTTQNSPSTPTAAVLKRLFAVSGNRCAFPKCECHLVLEDTLIGEVCHIRAASDGGPRADSSQSSEQRHGYENLILLCANHHKVVDDDTEAYTVDRLVKMKKDHEARWAADPNEDVEHGAQVLIGQIINARIVNQTFNLQAAAERALDNLLQRREEARRALAPELQRTIERALYIHGRTLANFICHSAGNGMKPNDLKQDFIPYRPSLYPNAPQVRELADDDVALLAGFYDSLTSLNDHVNDWWEREGQLPVNIFNSFRSDVSKSLKLGLRCIEQFGTNLFPPEYESWGSLAERIKRSLDTEENALEHHTRRWEAERAQPEVQMEKRPQTNGRAPGDPQRK